MLQKRNLTSAITIAISSLYTATYPDSFIFISPNNPSISLHSLYSSLPHLPYLPHSPSPSSLPLSLSFPNPPCHLTSYSLSATSSLLPHIGSFCISPSPSQPHILCDLSPSSKVPPDIWTIKITIFIHPA